MNNFHCPHLDRLGEELIEAYRRVEDRDVFCSTTDTSAPDDVAVLHHAMAEHRKLCPLCRRVAREMANNSPIRRSMSNEERSKAP